MKNSNRKALNVLFALVCVLGLALPGTAFAADYASITSTSTIVEKDASNQAVGKITINLGDDASFNQLKAGKVYAQVQLPTGVTISNTKVSDIEGNLDAENKENFSVEDVSSSALTIVNDSDLEKDDKIVIPLNQVNIGDAVSGNITAQVKIWSVSNGITSWKVSNSVVIAKVQQDSISVSAASKKLITDGDRQPGAKITLKESSAGVLHDGDEIFLTLATSGVRWTTSGLVVNQSGIEVKSSLLSNGTVLKLVVENESNKSAGTLEITPSLIVSSGTEGDVKVDVSGDHVDKTRLVIANVVADSTSDIDLNHGDDIYYLGSVTEGSDVELTLNPEEQIEAGDTLTLTLPTGQTWASDSAIDSSEDYIEGDRSNGNRTLELTFSEDTSDEVTFTNPIIKTDYNASLGSLQVKLDGLYEGKATIGKVAAPFTVSVDKKTVSRRASEVSLGNITIKEYQGGALKETDGNPTDDNQPGYLDIALPAGVSFAKTPHVDVTKGNLEVSVVGLTDSNRKLRLRIDDESTSTSTIVISDIVVKISSSAGTGELKAKIGAEYNVVSSNPLAQLSIATINNAAIPRWHSIFTIGNRQFYCNDKKYTMDVAPFIRNSRTYLPLRFAANAVGVKDQDITWNGNNQTILIVMGKKTIQMQIGNKTMKVNGVSVLMDTAPELHSDRTYLPIRWLANALGSDIEWDADTQTVTVDAD